MPLTTLGPPKTHKLTRSTACHTSISTYKCFRTRVQRLSLPLLLPLSCRVGEPRPPCCLRTSWNSRCPPSPAIDPPFSPLQVSGRYVPGCRLPARAAAVRPARIVLQLLLRGEPGAHLRLRNTHLRPRDTHLRPRDIAGARPGRTEPQPRRAAAGLPEELLGCAVRTPRRLMRRGGLRGGTQVSLLRLIEL
jgi:hypothetical protein